ncbi:peptidylprolyl isomerase [Kiloniella sp. b19]|uniref:peptidylprolyl isomerase n=1 Tax=Kiloniella sp. GXU_MW_B19 TaxID=3141326 RepID=UPI0031D1EB09
MAKTGSSLAKKLMAYVLFGLLILSFAAFGIGDIFTNFGNNQPVAKVGDREVSQQEFARDLSNRIQQVSSQFGQAISLRQAQALGLGDQVLATLVSRRLFEIQSEKMGLVAPREILQKELVKVESFKNESGVFDANRFQNILYQNGLSEEQFLVSLGNDIARDQLFAPVRQGVEMPTALARVLQQYQSEERSVDVVRIDHSAFSAPAAPADDVLASFYETVSNSFMAPEYRAVSYIHLDPASAAAKIAPTEEQIQDEFLAQQSLLAKPESRKLSQGIFGDQADAQAAADRINAGEDFAAVITELAGLPPVDLGDVTSGSFLPELTGPAFAIAAGEITAPVQSPLGWHVVKVESITPGEEVTLEEVHDQITRDTALRLATEDLVVVANQLDDELGGGSTLQEAANNLGLELVTLNAVDAEGLGKDGNPASDLALNQQFAAAVAATEAGSESLLEELNEGGYFIVRVESITPPAPRALNEVRNEVIALWQADQQRQAADTEADKLLNDLKAGNLPVASNGVSVQQNTLLSRTTQELDGQAAAQAVNAIFAAGIGESLKADANNSTFVVRVNSRSFPQGAEAEKSVAELRDNLAAQYQQDVYNGYLSSQEEAIGVSINADVLELIYSGVPARGGH